MGFTVVQRNAFVDSTDGLASVTHMSAHTAEPDDSGNAEAAGGSPAYAREAVSFAAASGGLAAVDTGLPAEFDVPAGTYTHVGFWTASSGGTFKGWAALSASKVFAAQGILRITAADMEIS
jgi:hypothetical protein